MVIEIIQTHNNLKKHFKYVVADKLFVQSSYSNCKVDGDKILLDISAVAMARYEKLELPTQVAQLPDLDIVMIIKPPLSLPTQNVLAYLAGYLLKKISANECIECQEQLIWQRFHSPEKDTAKYQFLDCKTYGEGYLIYPTATMITFVENL